MPPSTSPESSDPAAPPAATGADPDFSAPPGEATFPAARRFYWGAWIGSQLTGSAAPWDFSAVEKYEQNSGKRLSLLQFSSPFFDCRSGKCKPHMFPSTPFTAIREHGAIPFFSWNSAASDAGVSQPGFQLADIADGRYDDYIKEWAASAARWGHPFFLRFNWEMNGDWFPWSEGVNGNAGGSYVTAWRHVHDLFAAAGARNASWVWCPNIDPERRYTDLKGLYPGDAYVDWTCIDGYSHEPEDPGHSFKSIFQTVYDEVVRIAPDKPMVIGETGAVQNSHKPAWLTGMFRAMLDMPAVKAFMYFENVENPGNVDWSVATSPAAQSAFSAGINDPAFVENDFSSIETSPIPAP